jgi:hypothetical protein
MSSERVLWLVVFALVALLVGVSLRGLGGSARRTCLSRSSPEVWPSRERSPCLWLSMPSFLAAIDTAITFAQPSGAFQVRENVFWRF